MSYPSPEQQDKDMEARTQLDAVEDARRRLAHISARLDVLYNVDWSDPPPQEKLQELADESDYLEGRKRALAGWLAERVGKEDQ